MAKRNVNEALNEAADEIARLRAIATHYLPEGTDVDAALDLTAIQGRGEKQSIVFTAPKAAETTKSDEATETADKGTEAKGGAESEGSGDSDADDNVVTLTPGAKRIYEGVTKAAGTPPADKKSQQDAANQDLTKMSDTDFDKALHAMATGS